MIFTEEVLRQVIAWAQYRVLLSLGVIPEEDPLLTTDALLRLPGLEKHKEALEVFEAAYGEWYAFHLTILKAGKSGRMSGEELVNLQSLIERRDAAREALVAITN